jgi:uncharacterized heparinase superfamily protein
VEREFAGADGWQRASTDRLWLYHLHSFDDLLALDAKSREQWHLHLIRRWIRENPPVRGIGWEPYPLSRRIANWLKWDLDEGRLDHEARHSLAIQCRALRARIEWHLGGNHLLANAKALVFAGSYFEGHEAETWLRRGVRLIEGQVDEQILADGGHFERSPMYHAIVLEDFLDLVNLAKVFGGNGGSAELGRLGALLAEPIRRMLSWLRFLTHPDGGIAFFNDAALGVAPEPGELESYASRLGVAAEGQLQPAIERCRSGAGEAVLLTASGYARLHNPSLTILTDVAPLGPDSLPGHAHADTLSFELSLHGARLLVNSGTGTYTEGADRSRDRATASHNTLMVDGEDSSEVWASFRVARRARVLSADLVADGADLVVSGVHDGYRRLGGGVVHRREWRLSEHQLEVHDSVEGEGSHVVDVFFHLHPRWRVEAQGEGFMLLLRDDAVRSWLQLDGKLSQRIEESVFHVGFGDSRPGKRICGSMTGGLPITMIHRLCWQTWPSRADGDSP